MTTLTVRYNKLLDSLKDDENAVQLLSVVDEYEVEFSESDLIDSLTQDINAQDMLYGYSS